MLVHAVTESEDATGVVGECPRGDGLPDGGALGVAADGGEHVLTLGALRGKLRGGGGGGVIGGNGPAAGPGALEAAVPENVGAKQNVRGDDGAIGLDEDAQTPELN